MVKRICDFCEDFANLFHNLNGEADYHYCIHIILEIYLIILFT
jgi:hypothetical protein